MDRTIRLGALFAMLPLGALAQGNINMQGMSGLFNVPDASVLDYGKASFAWDRQVDGRFSRPNTLNSSGNDINFAAGALPHLEVVGRNVTRATTTGGSDLSFNIKIQLPWQIIDGLDFAVGEMDFGGAVNEFDTKFAVATWARGPFRATLGYGQADGRNLKTGRLDGAFGGIEFKATDWFSIIVEDDVHTLNTGFRVSTPEHWLPKDWKASMSWMLSAEEGVKDRQDWYGFSLQIPLAAPFERTLPKDRERVVAARAPIPREVIVERYGRDEVVEDNPLLLPPQSAGMFVGEIDRNEAARIDSEIALRQRFLSANFEKIRVQRYGREWVIAFENLSFNNNAIDALGIAAGVAATALPSGDRFYLQLERYGIPVFGFGGEVGAWSDFMQGLGALPAAVMETAPSSRIRRQSRYGGVLGNAVHRVADYLAFRPTVMIKPILASNVGTEFGVIDYSLAARADIVLPLWQGATINVTRDWNVYDTEDFTEDGPFGGVFLNQRVESGVKDRVFNQVIRHGGGFTTMLSYGQFFEVNEGFLLESRWEPGDGRHRFAVIASDFEDRDDDAITRRAKIGEYRYFAQTTNTEYRVQYGTFYNDDDGYRIQLAQHVGDVRLLMAYRKSEDDAFAALGFTIPLTPRRDIPRVAGVQVMGTPSWTYGLSTLLGERANFLRPGGNVVPVPYWSLNSGYFNSDRLSAAYVKANQERLREAWKKYGR